MDINAAERIAREFGPLGFELHQVMPRSLSLATDMMKLGKMDPNQYRSIFLHTIVGCAHSQLRHADLGEWELNKKSRKKELHLTNGLWTTRLLAATYDNRVPMAGRNQARRAFYTNAPVIDLSGQQAFLQQQDFLIVWTINAETGEIDLELVHTLGPWRWGQREYVDLRMPLPSDQADLDNLKFSQPDDDDDLDGLLGLVDPRKAFQRGVINGRKSTS